MQAWDANGDGKVTKTKFVRRLSGYIAHERPAWLPRIRAMANRTAVRLSCENSPLGKVCAELFRAFDTGVSSVSACSVSSATDWAAGIICTSGPSCVLPVR